MTTAKTLSYALDLPLVAVDALASIAAATLHQNPQAESLCVATDAYRGQLFVGTFTRAEILPPVDLIPADWTAHSPSVKVLGESQWKSLLGNLPDQTKFAGDIKILRDLADDRLERDCDAVGVGLLGIRAAALGAFVDPLRLVPRYLRMSAAEEKAAGS